MAPGIISRPTGNRRLGGLRLHTLARARQELRGDRHECILHSPKAVKGGHRGGDEQRRRKCEKRRLNERDVLRSMTRQKSVEQARGTQWLKWGQASAVRAARNASAVHGPCGAVKAIDNHDVAEAD